MCVYIYTRSLSWIRLDLIWKQSDNNFVTQKVEFKPEKEKGKTNNRNYNGDMSQSSVGMSERLVRMD